MFVGQPWDPFNGSQAGSIIILTFSIFGLVINLVTTETVNFACMVFLSHVRPLPMIVNVAWCYSHTRHPPLPTQLIPRRIFVTLRALSQQGSMSLDHAIQILRESREAFPTISWYGEAFHHVTTLKTTRNADGSTSTRHETRKVVSYSETRSMPLMSSLDVSGDASTLADRIALSPNKITVVHIGRSNSAKQSNAYGLWMVLLSHVRPLSGQHNRQRGC